MKPSHVLLPETSRLPGLPNSLQDPEALGGWDGWK